MGNLKEKEFTANWIEEREWTKGEGKIMGNPIRYGAYGVNGIQHFGPGIRVTPQNAYVLPIMEPHLYSMYNSLLEANAAALANVMPDWNTFGSGLQTALSSFYYNTGKLNSDLYVLINGKQWQKALDWWITHYTTAGGKPMLVTRRKAEAKLAAESIKGMGLGEFGVSDYKPLEATASAASVGRMMPIILVLGLFLLVKFLSKKKQGG